MEKQKIENLKNAIAALRANEAEMLALNAKNPATAADQEADDAAFEVLLEIDSQRLEAAVAALVAVAGIGEFEARHLIVYEPVRLDALIAKLA